MKTYTSKAIVNETNTAQALGSGDMPVFATPAMVALMENAAMVLAADTLPEGSATVGTMINVEHTRASGMGVAIEATATLTAEEGRKLTFTVVASDDKGEIGRGEHVRYVVDREKFLGKLK